MSWEPGDRVVVTLPLRPRGHIAMAGTVREVDSIPGRPGVRVDLDRPVNGVQDCYATHAELQPE